MDKHLGLAFALVAALAGTAAVCGGRGDSSPPRSGVVGERIPDLLLETIGGGSTTLHELTGPRGTVINLWATWCIPCRNEMPEISAFAEAAEHGVVVLGVAIESPEAEVRQWVEELAIAHPVVLGLTVRDVIRYFGQPGLPVTVIVDEARVIREVVLGVRSAAELHALVSRLGGVRRGS